MPCALRSLLPGYYTCTLNLHLGRELNLIAFCTHLYLFLYFPYQAVSLIFSCASYWVHARLQHTMIFPGTEVAGCLATLQQSFPLHTDSHLPTTDTQQANHLSRHAATEWTWDPIPNGVIQGEVCKGASGKGRTPWRKEGYREKLLFLLFPEALSWNQERKHLQCLCTSSKSFHGSQLSSE